MTKIGIIVAAILCFASCCCSNRTERASETLEAQSDTTVVTDTVEITDTVVETPCQE